MPYQITLPDGSIGMIDDSVPKNRAMEAAEAAYPDAFPGIGEQLLGAPAEFAKGFARGFVDPVSGGYPRFTQDSVPPVWSWTPLQRPP
jgi:hypothetical protein